MSKSPSLRRIQADIRELAHDPSDQYTAAPLENDMFEWHFTIRGAPGTDFQGGVYHGKILLPPEYPFKPPNILFLTPSGRFETNTKVCLSFSSFHPELWQPAWGIRLILEALISFLPTPADGAIGALDWTKEERVKLARESVKFRCPVCCEAGKTCVDLLPEVKSDTEGKKTKFHEEIEKLKMLQFQNHAAEEEGGGDADGDNDEKPAAAAETKVEKASTMDGQPEAAKPDAETKDKSTAEEKVEQPKTKADEAASTTTGQTERKDTPSKTIQEPNNTPAPTPAPTNTGQATANTASSSSSSTTTTVATAPTNTNEEAPLTAALEGTPLVSDHCLNGMIALLAIVVVVLLRQASELVDELRSLER